MAELLTVFFQILITNPLTVILVILGVVLVALAIIGNFPPIQLTEDKARKLMRFGVGLISSGVILAFLLAWVTSRPTTVSLTATVAPSTATNPLPPTETPVLSTLTSTSTSSPIPTDTPAPTFTETFTLAPTTTATPKPTSQPFYIISPRNGTTIGCSSEGPCLITVQVQWVSPTLANNQRLYILVRPKPEENFPYYVQPFPSHSSNGIWTAINVGLGSNDPAETHFWLCAVVTSTILPDGAQLSDRPSGSLICVDVYR